MTTQTYTVQDGDTLSNIAQRMGSSVTELRRLNPFIKNPNYVRSGWTLNLPDAQTAPDTPTQPQDNSPSVLHLDPLPAPPEYCSFNFCDEQACRRTTHYADLIYEVGQERFWLLREHSLNTLVAAADDLQKNLLTSDPESRIKALNGAGLLEPFLEPKASSFLDGPQSQRYLELEQELELLTRDIERLEAQAKKENGQNIDNTPSLSDEQRQQIGKYRRTSGSLQQERRDLDAKGYAVARDRGYRFENGQLYGVEAMKAREIIQRYLQHRQRFVDLGMPIISRDELDKFDREYQELLAELQRANAERTTPRRDATQWLLNSRNQFHYSELSKVLCEAAAYGLALPEYALKGDSPDIQDGIIAYANYHTLLRDKAALEKRVEAAYDNWVDVTKQALPSSLFAGEEKTWEELEAKEQAMKNKAEAFVKTHKPQLHLLWDPQSFTPQPQQRLVRTDFPLREISVPTERTRLRHLSLSDVLKDLDQRARHRLKEDLKQLQESAKNTSLNVTAGSSSAAQELFTSWLRMHDARPLELQDDWFDHNGFFRPEAFKRYLKDERIIIDNLRDDATFDAWGEDLKQILYKKSTLGPLRLFDNSPQARLIRCLTPPQSSLQTATTVIGPLINKSNGLSASANLTLDVNLAQGEVDIVKFELPERNKAEQKVVSYENKKQGTCGAVKIGAFCLTGSIKAWGFAGASMMLGANLRLGPDKQQNDDLGADTHRDAERRVGPTERGLSPHLRLDDALGAHFTLFAGIQAGIKKSASLLWQPPADLLTLKHRFAQKKLDEDGGWIELATLGYNADAALGAGANSDFKISLQNGKVVLRMKAAVVAGLGVEGGFNFIVGYKAILQIMDVFNKALVENNYQKMVWVQPEAFAYFSKLQFLASVGINAQWAFLLGYNKVERLYKELTAGKRAGPIALKIVKTKENLEIKRWYSSLTPEALGSLLHTLLQTPIAFEEKIHIENVGAQNKKHSARQSHLVQQQAIEIVLTAILDNARSTNKNNNLAYENITLAQERFGKALVRLESFDKPSFDRIAYCRNVYRMDDFMAVTTSNVLDDELMRERYRSTREILGTPMDQQYQVPKHPAKAYGVSNVEGSQ